MLTKEKIEEIKNKIADEGVSAEEKKEALEELTLEMQKQKAMDPEKYLANVTELGDIIKELTEALEEFNKEVKEG